MGKGGDVKRSTLKLAPLAIGAVAAAAAANALIALKTESRHPPAGRFAFVDGVTVHYTDNGTGPAVVLLHGNGVTLEDWDASGVVDALAKDHRVIAFDRPGFGYSERPRERMWTPAEQADLLYLALEQLGVHECVVVGHSWGTLVALELGLQHPGMVKRLLLLSGYFFPTFRPDVPVFAAPAIPVLGDLMRYTISPLIGRAIAPGLSAQLFAPDSVPQAFTDRLPLSLRPSQLRAAAEDTAFMIPSAAHAEHYYEHLHVPVAIIAGREDKIVKPEQSQRLASALPQARMLIVDGAGHMVHYTARGVVVETIATLAAATPPSVSGDEMQTSASR